MALDLTYCSQASEQHHKVGTQLEPSGQKVKRATCNDMEKDTGCWVGVNPHVMWRGQTSSTWQGPMENYCKGPVLPQEWTGIMNDEWCVQCKNSLLLRWKNHCEIKFKCNVTCCKVLFGISRYCNFFSGSKIVKIINDWSLFHNSKCLRMNRWLHLNMKKTILLGKLTRHVNAQYVTSWVIVDLVDLEIYFNDNGHAHD